MKLRLTAWLSRLKGILRAALGVPDYDAYIEHRQRTHPGEPVLSYADFFRQEQRRRYDGARGGRCC
jgi:uncharacterized short protein YbdD (DUF466 family)